MTSNFADEPHRAAIVFKTLIPLTGDIKKQEFYYKNQKTTLEDQFNALNEDLKNMRTIWEKWKNLKSGDERLAMHYKIQRDGERFGKKIGDYITIALALKIGKTDASYNDAKSLRDILQPYINKIENENETDISTTRENLKQEIRTYEDEQDRNFERKKFMSQAFLTHKNFPNIPKENN